MSGKLAAGMASLRRLRAWNRAIDLTAAIYRLTGSFPREERFGLTNQLRRAAASVAANIAEGNERDGVAERRRYLAIARGSLAEVETYLEIARRLGYVTGDAFTEHVEITDHLGAMLTRMRNGVRGRPELSAVPRPSPVAHRSSS